jgi:GTP-binding protein YchF
VGVVAVPDERLHRLTEMYASKKTVPAVIEFVDIAGLVKGASKGEGLGNKFLSHIREVDAVVHMVRCFEDGDVVHVEGAVDPARDAEIINMELILADLEILARRVERTTKQLKGDKKYQFEADVLKKLEAALAEGKTAREVDLSEDEREVLADSSLLTLKPVIYAATVSEDEIAGGGKDNKYYKITEEIAAREKAAVIPVSAKIEAEIAELDEEEKGAFLEELGLEESGLARLIKAGYSLLGLISFLTAGPQESRAWTIKKGTKAPAAAGKIHSDFERGFIRAEIIGYDELMACGGMAAAKEKGMVRSEGKDYVVKDGDVVLFRFNV